MWRLSAARPSTCSYLGRIPDKAARCAVGGLIQEGQGSSLPTGPAEHRLPRHGPISDPSLNPNLEASDQGHQNFDLGDASLPHGQRRRVQPRLNMHLSRACPTTPPRHTQYPATYVHLREHRFNASCAAGLQIRCNPCLDTGSIQARYR